MNKGFLRCFFCESAIAEATPRHRKDFRTVAINQFTVTVSISIANGRNSLGIRKG
jgi:hypothetical protein